MAKVVIGATKLMTEKNCFDIAKGVIVYLNVKVAVIIKVVSKAIIAYCSF